MESLIIDCLAKDTPTNLWKISMNFFHFIWLWELIILFYFFGINFFLKKNNNNKGTFWSNLQINARYWNLYFHIVFLGLANAIGFIGNRLMILGKQNEKLFILFSFVSPVSCDSFFVFFYQFNSCFSWFCFGWSCKWTSQWCIRSCCDGCHLFHNEQTVTRSIGMATYSHRVKACVESENYLLLKLLVYVHRYFFAWVGHFVYEKNRPATFLYPSYSLASDYNMLYEIATGKLTL